MRADDIKKIMENIAAMPYRTVLINGPWGVGKTYEIKKAINGNSSAHMISMFGMQSCEDIYVELAWRLQIDSKRTIGILKKAAFIADVVAKKANIVIDYSRVAKERVRSYYITKENEIIIFDDLERVGTNFSLETFLGFIEDLKNMNPQLTIVVVTNLSELSQEKYFNKFNEKVIDKIYNISSISSAVDWKRLGVNDDVALDFMQRHGLKNLRTIRKAQQFFDDVKMRIREYSKAEFQNDLFLRFIQQICYSVVVESYEQIYLKQVQEELDAAKDSENEYWKAVKQHELEDHIYRIGIKYLDDGEAFRAIIRDIYDYHQNNSWFSESNIVTWYGIFENIGTKAPFYLSDDEIQMVVKESLNNLYCNESVAEAIQKMDVIGQWAEVLEWNLDEVWDVFETYIFDFIDQTLIKGNNIELDMHWDISLQCDRVKKLVQNIKEKLPEKKIEKMIERIQLNMKSGNYNSAYEEIEELRFFIPINEEKLAEPFMKSLLDSSILPVGSIDEIQWRYLHKLYKLCHRVIPDELSSFTEEAIASAESKMLKYRLETLRKVYLTE